MRRDLIMAEALLQQTETPRHTCLMAQQSAEKAIKSIYAFLDNTIPKSHDLDLLKNLLPDDWEVKTLFSDLSDLSFWAVASRYPGNMPEATREDADTALAMAKAILDSVQNDLSKCGLPE